MKVKHIEKTTRQFKWILFIVVSIFASCYFYIPFGGLTLMIGLMLQVNPDMVIGALIMLYPMCLYCACRMLLDDKYEWYIEEKIIVHEKVSNEISGEK